MNYIDLKISIAPRADGNFAVKATYRGGGTGNSGLVIPDICRSLKGSVYSPRGSLNVASSSRAAESSARAIGEALYSALFQGEITERLIQAETEAARKKDTGVRIRISMDLAAGEMHEVASLPWELMRRPGQSPLASSERSPVVREFETSKASSSSRRSGKLLILGVSANPNGTAKLDLDNEKARLTSIWKNLDDVEYDWVDGRRDALSEQIKEKKYHIVHYMGHGGFLPDEGGFLCMENADGTERRVSGSELATLIQDDPLQVVFLNACNTGTSGASSGNHPFAGVASALIRNGVPAVVAMQFPISDRNAIKFANTFYKQIAKGEPVDAAVSQCRQDLYSETDNEWATPVLYMRTEDGKILNRPKPGETPRQRMTKAAGVASADPAGELPAILPVLAQNSSAPAGVNAAPPLQADSAAPPKPWFKKPMILGGIGAAALVFLLQATGGNGGSETETAPTTVEAGVADEGGQTAAEVANHALDAIAALPEDTWITDLDPEKTVNALLVNVTTDELYQLANDGNARAAYLYGNAVWYGRGGLAPSKASAVSWYRIAAEQGLAVAEYLMAFAYHSGVDGEQAGDGSFTTGVAINEAEAQVWLEKARAQGNESSWTGP